MTKTCWLHLSLSQLWQGLRGEGRRIFSSFLLLNMDWGQNKSYLILAEHWKKKVLKPFLPQQLTWRTWGAESLWGLFVSMVTLLSKSREDTEQKNMRLPYRHSLVKAPDLGLGRIVFYHLCEKEKKLRTALLRQTATASEGNLFAFFRSIYF